MNESEIMTEFMNGYLPQALELKNIILFQPIKFIPQTVQGGYTCITV